MTDRFARTDGSTTSPCNTTEGIYCGGTWRGTIDHLDYIQGMGFDAVMISPIIENIAGRASYGEAYHGYWPLDLYSLNSHFGTSQDLLSLSEALHSRGMYLLMDTVINNMAYMTNGSDPATHVDYSVFTPFNNSDYFHAACNITDWDNFTNAQLCQTGDWEVALPDLFTEHIDVQTLLETWAQDIIKKYSVDGLRVDAAKHVSPGFLKNFGHAVGGFMTGEVYQREVSIICDYQENYIGSVPNYPVYFSILEAFTKGNTSSLALKVEEMKNSCPDVTALVSFSENHDLARIAGLTEDISVSIPYPNAFDYLPSLIELLLLKIAKNTLTFTILFDGIPMIYQGQEQHFNGTGQPENREAVWLSSYNNGTELYHLIATLNRIRKHAYSLDPGYLDLPTRTVFQGGSELGFYKGVEGRQVLMLLSTQGINGGSYPVGMPVSFNAGTAVTEVLGCTAYEVDDVGQLTVNMAKGEPRVFFPSHLMEGSGLCGYSSKNVSYTQLVTGQSVSLGAKNKGPGDHTMWGLVMLTFMTSLMIF
ncbi:glycoside hydrolase superfamily [Penicillium macrosclerotiorum]|uniref:glycoside hydrolase superfamily n=1 Tax=Penicillium macrosclerotiorum TaxID=303699 RepID=UPI002548F902|nr:glycoside hydrolase superfamily [Penicillium macrosclerotiorum]KAJ5690457.1 glycoside hydrolase superfamily [Penicillium macrosclerotiorum]